MLDHGLEPAANRVIKLLAWFHAITGARSWSIAGAKRAIEPFALVSRRGTIELRAQRPPACLQAG